MSEARPRIDRSAAVTGLLTVAAANFLYLAGLPLILDPMMSMEPFYIHMAQRPASSILTEDPSWGPLYALWLKPFVAMLADPVAVYTANLYALSLGVSILIFLYLLLMTGRAAAGVGAALFFLICDFNVPLSSKVSGFALLVVLAGLTASELVPAGARRMSAATMGVLLAAYARPELYPAALCLCLAALWLAYREAGESGWMVLAWPATCLACILIPAVSIGTPLFSPYGSSDRLLMAFREHFAWNWSRWHGQWQYFLSIWDQEFAGADGALQALRSNPRAVAHHLIDNLLGTVAFMATSAFDHYPLLASATSPILTKVENLLVSAGVFGSLFLVITRPELRRQMRARYGHALVPYAAMTTFSFAAATAIFPLAYYLVIPCVLLLLAGTLALTLIIPAAGGSTWRTRLVAALVCLVAIPRPFILPSAYVVPGSPFKARITVARAITDTIDFIRALRLPSPVHVLALTDGIGEMLGSGFHEIKVWQRGAQPLDAYMRDNHVDLIVSLEPGQDSFAFSDPYWQLVQKTPDAAGFTRLSVPNHEAVRIYVRTDLAPKQGDTPLQSEHDVDRE